MFSHAIDRYTKNFGPLFLVGLVTALITLVPMLIIGAITGGAAVFNYTDVFQTLMAGGTPDLGSVIGLLVTVLTGVALALAVLVILGPISFVARVSAAKDALQGEPIQIGKALKAGAAAWGRGIGYVLLMGLTMGLVLFLLFIVATLPLALGILGIILFIPLLLGVAYVTFVLQAAFWYGMYAMVEHNLSLGDAFGRAWGGLFKNMGDHFAAGGVLLLMYAVFLIAGKILGYIPWGVGALALSAVSGVFYPLYMGARLSGVRKEPVYGGATPAQAPGQQPPQQ